MQDAFSMLRRLIYLSAFVLWFGTLEAAAQSTPSVSGIYPNAALQNKVVSIVIRGSNLDGATTVTLSGTGITAAILTGGTATVLPITITVAADTAISQRTLT